MPSRLTTAPHISRLNPPLVAARACSSAALSCSVIGDTAAGIALGERWCGKERRHQRCARDHLVLHDGKPSSRRKCDQRLTTPLAPPATTVRRKAAILPVRSKRVNTTEGGRDERLRARGIEANELACSIRETTAHVLSTCQSSFDINRASISSLCPCNARRSMRLPLTR